MACLQCGRVHSDRPAGGEESEENAGHIDRGDPKRPVENGGNEVDEGEEDPPKQAQPAIRRVGGHSLACCTAHGCCEGRCRRFQSVGDSLRQGAHRLSCAWGCHGWVGNSRSIMQEELCLERLELEDTVVCWQTGRGCSSIHCSLEIRRMQAAS